MSASPAKSQAMAECTAHSTHLHMSALCGNTGKIALAGLGVGLAASAYVGYSYRHVLKRGVRAYLSKAKTLTSPTLPTTSGTDNLATIETSIADNHTAATEAALTLCHDTPPVPISSADDLMERALGWITCDSNACTVDTKHSYKCSNGPYYPLKKKGEFDLDVVLDPRYEFVSKDLVVLTQINQLKQASAQDFRLNISVDVNTHNFYTTGQTDTVYRSMWTSGLTDTGATTSYGVLSNVPLMSNAVEVFTSGSGTSDNGLLVSIEKLECGSDISESSYNSNDDTYDVATGGYGVIGDEYGQLMIAAYRPSSTTPSNAHNHAAISLQLGMMTSSTYETIEEVDADFYNSTYYNMLLRCQIKKSSVKSYGVLSIPAPRAIIVANAQLDVIKTESYCSSGTATDTDSATGSDGSIDKFEVQNNSINGDQDNVLTRMDITTGNMANEAFDLGISGENMSVLCDMEFSELSKLRYDAVECNDLEKMLYYLCHPLAKARVYDAQEWMVYKESHRGQVSARLAHPLPRWLKIGSERLTSMKAAQLAVNEQFVQAQASAARLSRATAAVQAGAAAKAIAAAHSTTASMPAHNNNTSSNYRRYSGGSTRFSSNTYSSMHDARYSHSGNGTYTNKFENGNSSSYNNSGTTFRQGAAHYSNSSSSSRHNNSNTSVNHNRYTGSTAQAFSKSNNYNNTHSNNSYNTKNNNSTLSRHEVEAAGLHYNAYLAYDKAKKDGTFSNDTSAASSSSGHSAVRSDYYTKRSSNCNSNNRAVQSDFTTKHYSGSSSSSGHSAVRSDYHTKHYSNSSSNNSAHYSNSNSNNSAARSDYHTKHNNNSSSNNNSVVQSDYAIRHYRGTNTVRRSNNGGYSSGHISQRAQQGASYRNTTSNARY
eukprot:7949-Heterococcus_DN1.PRE.5